MAQSCENCGIDQHVGELDIRSAAYCFRCGCLLDAVEPMDLNLGLSWMIAEFILLFPANLLPLMQATLGPESRENYISNGVTALWQGHWPLLAFMFAAFAIVFPFLRAGMMIVVLGAVRLNRRPKWLGYLYRRAQDIELWAMSDVLVLAGFVVFMRTEVQLQGRIEWGGWCLIMAAALQILSPWCLSSHRIWRAIRPDERRAQPGPTISCEACALVLPMRYLGHRCPRCWKRLRERKLNSMTRTAALVAAGYILYFPAYYYAMSYDLQPGGVKYHTIIDGVKELIAAGFWPLAVIIVITSILIPLLKLIGLTWMLFRVRHPTSKHLVFRTRLYRVIHRMGRWSNVDPFIVALMAPLLSFPGVVEVHVGRAALPFALVVAFTMLAAKSFDPRLMWDAAVRKEEALGRA
ncbi:MAG: paraquat-inducible protein A [Phycisphaerae bacterium]